jgi:hypothetical protein
MAKVKIPKRVAGMKVPKKVRRQAKKALKLTASPAVRDLALTGLTLAARSLVDNARNDRSRPGAAAGARPDGLDLGAVIHAAVAEGARRFLEGFEEGAAAAAPKPAKSATKRTRVKQSAAQSS